MARATKNTKRSVKKTMTVGRRGERRRVVVRAPRGGAARAAALKACRRGGEYVRRSQQTLFWAIRHARDQHILPLLSRASLNAEEATTSLAFPVYCHHPVYVDGINVLAGCTPLAAAVWYRRPANMIAAMVTRSNRDQRTASGLTPLHVAVLARHWPAVRVLVAAGADPGETCRWLGATNQYGDRLTCDWNALHLAVGRGRGSDAIPACIITARTLNSLGKHGEDGVSYFTPLHAAALRGNAGHVRMLLAHGAEVAVWSGGPCPTPLIAALNSGAEEFTDEQMLALNSPKTLNFQTDYQPGRNFDFGQFGGVTALSHALNARRWAVARELIQKGANINLVSQAGETPLLRALASSSQDSPVPRDLVEVLITPVTLNHRQDRHDFSITPLKEAIDLERWDLVALLVQHGARWEALLPEYSPSLAVRCALAIRARMASFADEAFKRLGVTHVAVEELKLLPVVMLMKQKFDYTDVYNMYPESAYSRL